MFLKFPTNYIYINLCFPHQNSNFLKSLHIILFPLSYIINVKFAKSLLQKAIRIFNQSLY